MIHYSFDPLEQDQCHSIEWKPEPSCTNPCSVINVNDLVICLNRSSIICQLSLNAAIVVVNNAPEFLNQIKCK